MDTSSKQRFIREIAARAADDSSGTTILWSRHAIAKAVREQITRQEIEAALISAEVIEDYPAAHRPLPDCLVLGWLDWQNPLHAVVALDLTNV
ncbi:MAG: DUF4258 domain-containing protein, partial [Candidatus Promineofilum sp.]|nr:DUF4258 domain-containing protein [Promineifilum sp.]